MMIVVTIKNFLYFLFFFQLIIIESRRNWDYYLNIRFSDAIMSLMKLNAGYNYYNVGKALNNMTSTLLAFLPYKNQNSSIIA